MSEGTSRYGLIKSTGTSHWYSRKDGSPQHHCRIQGASKAGHYPSVTSILKVWPKEALDRWKIEQAIMSAITLPRLPGESDDDFAKRVVHDMGEEAKGAASKGTIMHDMLATRLTKGMWPTQAVNDGWGPWAEAWESWIKTEIVKVHKSEEVLLNHRLGYAGTVDLVADTRQWGFCVLDFKNQNVRDKGPAFYDEWLFQLSAYAACLEEKPQNLVSLVLNRNKPDAPAVKVWDLDDVPRAWAIFKTCMALWVLNKNYDPLEWVDPKATKQRQESLPF